MRTLSRNLVAVAILISAAVLWTGNVSAAGGGGRHGSLSAFDMHNTLETSDDLPKGFWRQYLRVTEFGGAIYLDEANGAFVPKAR